MNRRWLGSCVMALQVMLLCALVAPLHAQGPPIDVFVTPLRSSACADTFVVHDLAHTTAVNSQPVRMFDSNGSGLAINDLNVA